MSNEESVEKLSQVLSNLQDMSDVPGPVTRKALNDQVDILRDVQTQMQTQLAVHDAQIAALQEIIAVLTAKER